jgi:hypothetical protein
MAQSIKVGSDTWAESAHASKNHALDPSLQLNGSVSYGYIMIPRPFPLGANIIAATLHLRMRGSQSSTAVSVNRIGQSWAAGKLNWNNRPSLTGSPVVVTQTNAGTSTDWAFDVTTHMQSVANGSAWWGWRISTTATSVRKIVSANDSDDFRPTLEVEWSDAPDEPTDLKPVGIIGIAKPTVAFDFTDVAGDQTLAAVQVQINPTNTFTSPAFDSGTVASSVAELDLSTTAYAGLSDGSTAYWRARVQDGAGLWSAWSDAVSITRHNKGTVTISNPAAPTNNFVTESTPPIIWSFSGTQKAWRVIVIDPDDPAGYLWDADSGRTTGTDTSWTVPSRVITDSTTTYTVKVRVWDTYDRASSPGDPPYAEATRNFTFNDDATVAAPATLTATQPTGKPTALLTWTRSTAPDSWIIRRDGKVVEDDLDPADTLSSGTTHTWRTRRPGDPQVPHTWRVQAVVNGKASSGGPTATLTVSPGGIWIADISADRYVCIFGDDPGTFAYGEDAAVYTPIGGRNSVRVVQSLRGLEGQVTGVLVDVFGRTAKDYESDLLYMKARPEAEHTLILADVAIPVVIGNIAIGPTSATQDGNVFKTASVDFWQSDDLPFRPRL